MEAKYQYQYRKVSAQETMKAFSSQKQTLYFALILVRDWTHSRMMCSPVKYQNQEIDQLPLLISEGQRASLLGIDR